jgi:hypothetical protein
MRESFPSHSSSPAKASLVRPDPLLDEPPMHLEDASYSSRATWQYWSVAVFAALCLDNSFGTHQATGVAQHLGRNIWNHETHEIHEGTELWRNQNSHWLGEQYPPPKLFMLRVLSVFRGLQCRFWNHLHFPIRGDSACT